jgi:hypothetical protein
LKHGVKKGGSIPSSVGSVHKDKRLPDDLMRFSFRHYQPTEKFYLSAEANYAATLLDRLREVSSMRVSEFRANKSRAIRAHTLDWTETSEKSGYSHLTQQLQQCEPWQFCLSANEHGRIHGILIDEVFYVVWLDPGHKMYP